MNTLKAALVFYKEFQFLNIPVSFFFTIISLAEADNIINHLIFVFLVLQITGGFALSAFIFEGRYKNRYFFYYNWGLSRIHLYGFAFVVNLVVLLIVSGIILAI